MISIPIQLSILSSHGSTYVIALSESEIPAVVGSTITPMRPRNVSTWFSSCSTRLCVTCGKSKHGIHKPYDRLF